MKQVKWTGDIATAAVVASEIAVEIASSAREAVDAQEGDSDREDGEEGAEEGESAISWVVANLEQEGLALRLCLRRLAVQTKKRMQQRRWSRRVVDQVVRWHVEGEGKADVVAQARCMEQKAAAAAVVVERHRGWAAWMSEAKLA